MLIFSDFFKKNVGAINYLDVGARGGIADPWTKFSPWMLNVIGFEPDPAEAEMLSKLNPDSKYYPNALWGSDEVREFYLCDWESTSSMYPPDEINNLKYADAHCSKRTVKKIVNVQCSRLDSLLQTTDYPDFIKIDTQGAELEILKGASGILNMSAPIVLAETWCTPIYKGMPLTHKVMEFMYELGYSVFDLGVAAAWRHKNSSLSKSHCKSSTIGFDLVFVKNAENIEFKTASNILKYVALLELYGFRDYALATLENYGAPFPQAKKAIQIIIENERNESSLLARANRFLRRKLGQGVNLWPSLH